MTAEDVDVWLNGTLEEAPKRGRAVSGEGTAQLPAARQMGLGTVVLAPLWDRLRIGK